LAEKRLLSVLGRHGVATMRILEQKISDAGPNNQRIDPHVLTGVRRNLLERGVVNSKTRLGVPWYSLSDVDADYYAARLDQLGTIHERLDRQQVTMRIGQALEIAVYRALTDAAAKGGLHFFGHYRDLAAHDDTTLYQKDEPLSLDGKCAPNKQCVDFIVISQDLAAGIEVKNIREWIYPDRREVKDLIAKCLAIDAIPVLIARRIHFSTWSVFNLCGVIFHQTYNQRYPASEHALAADVRHKDLLGYHDVRVGSEPDARLTAFISQHLASLMPSVRASFLQYRDLLDRYVSEEIDYPEFAGRVKRRSRGEDEDGDKPWLEPNFEE